jgi:DNA-binding NarL/FixJ family response regulator
MPGGDGITATHQLTTVLPDIRVLILTMFDLDDYVVTALRAGASGFLLKTTAPEALIASIKEAASGGTTLGPTVLARLVESYVNRPAPVTSVPALADLTGREMDVLRSMSQGYSNAEIAAELYLAETTVKTHVARVLAKLGVRDRVRAVVLAHRAGVGA